MQPPDTIEAAPTYCKRCGYSLIGLTDPRCPECGRPFDPTNPRTFRCRPERALWRWMRRTVIVLMCVVAVLGGTLGWLYWDWRQDRAASEATWKAGGVLLGRTFAFPEPLDRAFRWYGTDTWLFRIALRESDVTWGGAPREPDFLQRARKLRYLERMVLKVPELREEDFRTLGTMQGLVWLCINRANATDAHLAHLKGLRHLEWLAVRGPEVTDATLAWLPKTFPKLENLSLNDTSVSDAAMPQLARLQRLKYLTLSGSRITDQGLASLRGLSQLESLWLDGTAVGDAGMAVVAALPNLKVLGLSKTAITDAGLAHLASMPNLENLQLNGTQITNAGLAHVMPLPKLNTLLLRDTAISDDGIEHLCKRPHLRNVDFANTRVTEAGRKRFDAAFPFFFD